MDLGRALSNVSSSIVAVGSVLPFVQRLLVHVLAIQPAQAVHFASDRAKAQYEFPWRGGSTRHILEHASGRGMYPNAKDPLQSRRKRGWNKDGDGDGDGDGYRQMR